MSLNNKKRLFTSPVKSNIPNKVFGSPSSTKNLSFTGYIVLISSESNKSNSGNSFFDVLLKIGGNQFQVVRVMERGQEREVFQKHRSKAVTIIVSESNGTMFYNVMRGSAVHELKYTLDFEPSIPTTPLGSNLENQVDFIFVAGGIKWIEEERLVKGNFRVRKSVIKDETGELLLNIWNNLIDKIKEDHWYQLSEIEVKTYYGTELTTTPVTVLEEITKHNITWNEETLKNYSKAQKETTSVLCCPSIIAVEISETLECPKCQQHLSSSSSEKILKCSTCGRKVNVKQCKKKFQGELDVEKDGNSISLVFYLNVVLAYFPKFIGVLAEYADMEDCLLLMNDVDITYGSHNKLINIKNHIESNDISTDTPVSPSNDEENDAK